MNKTDLLKSINLAKTLATSENIPLDLRKLLSSLLVGIKEYEEEIKELNNQKTTAPIDQLYSTKVDSLAISKKSSVTDAINAIRKILSSNYAEEFHGSHSDIEKKKNMEVIIKKLIKEENFDFSDTGRDLESIMKEIVEGIIGFYPIEDFLMNTENDETFIEEIRIDSRNDISILENGRSKKTDREFKTSADLKNFVDKLLRMADQEVALNQSSPYARLRLGTTTRVSIMASPIAKDDYRVASRDSVYQVVIRKQRTKPFTRDYLIKSGSINEYGDKLVETTIRYGISQLWVGGTGTGKTAMMSAFTNTSIPEDVRTIVMAEIDEMGQRKIDPTTLKPLNSAITWELTSPDVKIYGQLKGFAGLANAALTFTPETIILQETKGGEIKDLMTLATSGHQVMTTLHANTIKAMFIRIVLMYQESGVRISEQLIQAQIPEAFPIIHQIDRYKDGSRKIYKSSEIVGFDTASMTPIFRTLNEFKVTDTIYESVDGVLKPKVLGEFKAVEFFSDEMLERLRKGGLPTSELEVLSDLYKKSK